MVSANKGRVSTEKFIRTYMFNQSGTIASYLQDAPSTNPDIVAGREALSESVGLWLEYGLAIKDKKLFSEMTEQLRSKFINSEGHIYWKISADGVSEVTTNALGDDLRIIHSLLQAYELWGEEDYFQLAEKTTKYLMDYTRSKDHLVDFYDDANQYASPTLSLVYIDVAAFQQMRKYEFISNDDYNKHLAILSNMPRDTIFYPKLYNVETKEYIYDESVNLIDQLIVALHLGDAQLDNQVLFDLLKQKYTQSGKIYGVYNARTLEPAVEYESPAVYALAILLALQHEDREWAEKWYQQMIGLEQQHGNYAGGYVFDNNTHAFDNLFPLLAKTQLH